MENTIQSISIDAIRPNPLNPRRKMNPEEIEGLAKNIKSVGLLQPITVRKLFENTDGLPGEPFFQIVCGHRRFEAAKLAGFNEIDCIVRQLTHEQAYDIMVTENLQREDVDPFDEASAFIRLRKMGYDTESLAEKFGKSASYILSRQKLTDLIPEFRDLYDQGAVSFSHCLVLARLTEGFQRDLLFRYSDKVDSYSSLRDKNVSELRKAILQCGCRLKDALFDTTLCKSCPKNTACGSLFIEETEAVCEDGKCYDDKTVEAILEGFEAARRRNPDFFILQDRYIPGEDAPYRRKRVYEELQARGFKFVEGNGYDYENLNLTGQYNVDSEKIVCYTFGWPGALGQKLASRDNGVSYQYKDDWNLNRYARQKNEVMRDIIDEITREEIRERKGKMLDVDIDCFLIKAALLYIAENAGVTLFEDDDDRYQLATNVSLMLEGEVYSALDELLRNDLESSDALLELYRRVTIPDDVDFIDEAHRRYIDKARQCWHGYGEVSDEDVLADLEQRAREAK